MASPSQHRIGAATGAAIYVGALLGPGVLFVPGLALAQAGPASIVVWVALLAASVPLAVTFAALGVRHPTDGGVAAYAEAAFGASFARVTAWLFLGAIVIGAPAVVHVGGAYVADLAGGSGRVTAIAAVAMLLTVVAANALGLHVTLRLQRALSAGLALLLVVVVGAALPHVHSSAWHPFAPHGTHAVVSTATLVMFSFFGWEAVAQLVALFRDPGRDLPRAMVAAFVVTTVLYVGLVVATIGVLAHAGSSVVPVADLARTGLGGAGRSITVVLAAMLTMGTVNAYIASGLRLVGALAEQRVLPARFPRLALPALALYGVAMIVLLDHGAVGVSFLTRGCSACLVAVYVAGTAAGVRLLRGTARGAATVGLVASVVVLVAAGTAAVFPVVLALLARPWPRRGRPPADDPALVATRPAGPGAS
ncbi:MAG TPA: amino acid permease [Gaiellaceae bacterium]|nr:amino acid permease [Gaiellaceae bacterium]